MCFGGNVHTFFTEKITEVPKKSISYLKSSVTSISDRKIHNLGTYALTCTIDYAFRHSKNSVKECKSKYFIYDFLIVFLLKVKLI